VKGSFIHVRYVRNHSLVEIIYRDIEVNVAEKRLIVKCVSHR
jgi:hypothetical protein